MDSSFKEIIKELVKLNKQLRGIVDKSDNALDKANRVLDKAEVVIDKIDRIELLLRYILYITIIIVILVFIVYMHSKKSQHDLIKKISDIIGLNELYVKKLFHKK